MKTIFILAVLFLSTNVFAYPQFIGFSYKSCITCHYNPFGNGPVNDYGRAVGGTLVSSRGFYDDYKPEDLIAKQTGFFFKENNQKIFRPFIGYRGMFMKSNFGANNSQSSFIHMQADANMVARFGSNNQYIASYTFGYAPVPRALQGTSSGDSMKEYRSHEYYVGYRPIPEFGIYVGLMDKPFGIRVVEHNSYSRTTPLLNMNDQSHGVVLHYAGQKIEGGIDVFLGNLGNEKDIQSKGVSGTFEFTAFDKNRFGASFLKQKNDYLDMTASAIHSRSELVHGTSLLFELGLVNKKSIATGYSKKEYYTLLQNHINTARGFFILNSVEYYKNSQDKTYKVRFGPGLQYFPIAKLETRIDLYNTRNFNDSSSSKDRWDLLAQIHIWL